MGVASCSASLPGAEASPRVLALVERERLLEEVLAILELGLLVGVLAVVDAGLYVGVVIS